MPASSALLVLLFAQSALAADNRREQAVEICRIQMPPDRYAAMMEQMYRTMAGASGASQPEKDQFVQRMTELTPRILSYPEFMDMMADLLAQHFTGPELTQLHQWYVSPVGQKQLQLMPTLMSEVGQKLQAIIPARMQKIMQEEQAKQKAGSGGKRPAAHPDAGR